MTCNPTIQAAADLVAVAESTRGIPGAWLSVNGLWCWLPASADHTDVGLMREALHSLTGLVMLRGMTGLHHDGCHRCPAGRRRLCHWLVPSRLPRRREGGTAD
jgi:hypothetical protein